MAVIEVEKLSYTYALAETPALSQVSFTVEPGEIVAIIGANGSGKSTLCYALTGFIPHFYRGTLSGRVRLAGLDTHTQPLAELVTVAGLVFQNPGNQISGAKFTVFEEVGFGLENLGVPRPEMRRRIEQALALTGIAPLAQRSPFELSGGQQQRLALASMLAMAPQVLVLDEPTSQLDPLGSRDVLAAIQQLSRQGMAIILVEHKLEWIAAFADRVIALAEGRIILEGPPWQVLTSPLLETHFIGRTRYTQAAEQAQALDLWPAAQPLPVTLPEAVAGFQAARRQERMER